MSMPPADLALPFEPTPDSAVAYVEDAVRRTKEAIKGYEDELRRCRLELAHLQVVLAGAQAARNRNVN